MTQLVNRRSLRNCHKNNSKYMYLTGTSTASAMYTLNYFSLFEFFFGYTTDTFLIEIGITWLNATKTTKIFVALLFPLS